MGIRSTALGLALGAALCAPALAQETKQTVEGAQRFLEIVLPGVRINANTWLLNNKPVDLSRYGEVLEVTTVARCHTRVRLKYDKHDRRMRNPDNGRWEDFSWNAHTRTLDMRFDQWTEVETRGKLEVWAHSTAGRPIRMLQTSESLTARLAHALDFLRQNCDAAARTGF